MQNFRSEQHPDPHPAPPPPSLFRRVLREFVAALLPAVVITLFINVFVARAAMVDDGPSMQPNLYVGYRMMTEKISYRFHEPQRGDIVLAKSTEENIILVKRVIGLSGEEITVRNGHAYINGDVLDEPWVVHWGGAGYPATIIPDGHVFIIGDNRLQSRDSRAIGPIPIENIQGRVVFVYWPLDKFEFFP